MKYACENCQYYRQCPKKDPLTGVCIEPNSLPCIAIHENPERGLKVANASIDELIDMLKEKLEEKEQ